MKPNNWSKLSDKIKQEIAVELVQSMRGQYLISQALVKAIAVMSKEKYPEISNIQDMEILREMLFPLFFEIDKATLEKLRKRKNDEKKG